MKSTVYLEVYCGHSVEALQGGIVCEVFQFDNVYYCINCMYTNIFLVVVAIQNGELPLGEPCHPQIVTRMSVNNGQLHKTEEVVCGRKISLLEIRKKLLTKHETLMHLHTDQEIQSLSSTEVY